MWMASFWPDFVVRAFPQSLLWCSLLNFGFIFCLMRQKLTWDSRLHIISQVTICRCWYKGGFVFLKKKKPCYISICLRIRWTDLSCHSDCGGMQSGEGGVIYSPGYPNNYPSPSRCAWLLEAPEGHTIAVNLYWHTKLNSCTILCFTFLLIHTNLFLLFLIDQLTFTYFEVEEHSQCTWDSVTIYNGGSPGAPVIGQYCGHTSPGTIQSGSNKLAIMFLADHSVSKGGFVATWSVDSSGMKSPTKCSYTWFLSGCSTFHLWFFFSSGCGGVIHADLGTIKSPNYPQNFPSNSECSWTIIAHEGNHLEMGFASEFQIPDSSEHCQSSYIKVTIWKIFMHVLHLHKRMLITNHNYLVFIYPSPFCVWLSGMGW